LGWRIRQGSPLQRIHLPPAMDLALRERLIAMILQLAGPFVNHFATDQCKESRDEVSCLRK
jgi:hypothetical protein